MTGNQFINYNKLYIKNIITNKEKSILIFIIKNIIFNFIITNLI